MQLLFGNLPPEINFWIDSFFDRECRLRARLICKSWLKIFNQTHFDIYPDESQLEAITETFSRCTHPFSVTFHKSDRLHSNSPHLSSFGTKARNLTGLKILSLRKKDRGMLVSLSEKMQRVEGQISATTPEHLIGTSLTHLDVLEIASSSKFPNLEFLSCNYPAKILHLLQPTKLTTLIARNFKIAVSMNATLNQFTNLKVLKLDRSCSVNRSPLKLSLPNLEVLENLVHSEFTCRSNRLTALKLMSKFLRTASLLPTLKSLTIDTIFDAHLKDNDLTALKVLTALEELNLDVPAEGEINGTFLRFMNRQTLTKLATGIKATDMVEFSPFSNLRELRLILRRPDMTLDRLSNLSKLTKMAIGSVSPMPYMEWLNKLTDLQELYLDFKLSENSKVPLDLANLVNLRTLVIPVKANKIISSLNKLTKLRRLEFPLTQENIFNLIYLTALSFFQAPDNEQVTKLTRLRELNCIVVTNEEIIELTKLQKLTTFICRSSTADYRYLTLLTSLQSVAFSNKMSIGDWGSVTAWSSYNAYPDVARKLPHIIYAQKEDRDGPAFCFTLL